MLSVDAIKELPKAGEIEVFIGDRASIFVSFLGGVGLGPYIVGQCLSLD